MRRFLCPYVKSKCNTQLIVQTPTGFFNSMGTKRPEAATTTEMRDLAVPAWGATFNVPQGFWNWNHPVGLFLLACFSFVLVVTMFVFAMLVLLASLF